MSHYPDHLILGLGLLLATLAVLCGDSLQDFAIALLLGLDIGTYSSVFTAAPIAVTLEGRWPALPEPTPASGTRPRPTRRL